MKKNPDDAKVQFTLGMLGMDQKENSAAEKHFKKCIGVCSLITSATYKYNYI